jgi:hypothetical protein
VQKKSAEKSKDCVRYVFASRFISPTWAFPSGSRAAPFMFECALSLFRLLRLCEWKVAGLYKPTYATIRIEEQKQKPALNLLWSTKINLNETYEFSYPGILLSTELRAIVRLLVRPRTTHELAGRWPRTTAPGVAVCQSPQTLHRGIKLASDASRSVSNNYDCYYHTRL